MMQAVRENTLNSTYQALIEVAFMGDPLNKIEDLIDPDFMGYGTAPDEKLFCVNGIKWMVERQREEVTGLCPEIKRNQVYHRILSNGTSALFVEELDISLKDDKKVVFTCVTMRLSTLLEYNGKSWKIIHCHASVPDANTMEGSAWPIEEWKRKNTELETLVREKTTDLLAKNRDLKAKSKKLEQAKQKIQKAYQQLEAAKDQLVQQEKLASLGQLTAGIAHEIKNPLNFVNNFSDLNIELIEEVFEELRKSDKADKLYAVTEILTDIRSNLGIIHQHGTRADGIVRSMLQHSRGGSGKTELTDLNKLVREYVNFSFHGMRAGQRAINVSIDLQLDDRVGMIPLIREDFSRVILNLCNNAFDAMRDKQVNGSDEKYDARLSVRTSNLDGKVQIEIEDNGSGISERNRDRILQPFFTTKKGTEGTGLGLSISNDIIKAHNGVLELKSELDVFTLFRILLPQGI